MRRFLGSILFLLLAWPASGQIGRYGSCEEAKSDLAAQAHMAVVKGIPHDYRAIDVIEQVRRECKLSYVGMGKHIPAFVRQLRAVRERSHKSHRIKYQELLEFRKYGYSIDPDSILQEARSAGIEADVAQQALLKSRPKREISEEQCRPRDLRGKLGPVEDQDSVISCDGYAAKALIKFKTGVDVSALDLSFLFYKDLSGIDRLMRSVFSYLSVGPALQLQLTSSRLPFTPDTVGSLAIEAGLEQGFCREEDFKSDDFEYSRKKTDFLHALQAIQGLKDSSYREHLVSLTGKSELDCEGSLRLVQTVFPGVDLSGLREILQTATTKDFVKDLASRSCKTRFFPGPKFKVQQPIYSIFSSKGLGV